MIIPLYATSINQVATRLTELRAQSGVAALARHLTLLIECAPADMENSIQAARAATMGHPGRVVVVTAEAPDSHPAMDAQIRVGSDSGSGELIVLRLVGMPAEHLDAVVTPLLVPDTPVAVWWPSQRPETPATSTLGALASRRITDAREAPEATVALKQLTAGYTPGDTDLCWARLTPWRAMLVAALKGAHSAGTTADPTPGVTIQTEPDLAASVNPEAEANLADTGTGSYGSAPSPPTNDAAIPGANAITSAVVSGPGSVSADLMAAWIGSTLRVPVRRREGITGALSAVELNFSGGGRLLLDKEHTQAGVVLRLTGQPDQHLVLSRRSTPECLAEELRRLGPDQTYDQLVTEALPRYCSEM